MAAPPVPPLARNCTLAEIAAPVASALAEVERCLVELIPEDMGGMVPLIYRHILGAGGKRLRPLLTLLSAAAVEGDPLSVVNLAMAVEVLHLSSLIHDDVIDEAAERRGRPSVRQQWGNRASILVGDFLVAEVFRRMTDGLGREALEVLARSVAEMCQAELMDPGGDPTAVSEARYFAHITGKTAALMAAACEIGAMGAGKPSEALRSYGRWLGEAFQIVDDLLDLYGSAERLGKPVLQDLAHGQLTLPIIHALEVAGERRDQLIDLIIAAREDAVAAREAADLTVHLGGRQYAEETAHRLLIQAQAALRDLPDTSARASLHALTEYVLQRQS